MLKVYEETWKHERDARCAAREDAREAEERSVRQAARKKDNLEIWIELAAARNTSRSDSRVAEIEISDGARSNTISICHRNTISICHRNLISHFEEKRGGLVPHI